MSTSILSFTKGSDADGLRPLTSQPLQNFWYLAMNGKELKRGTVKAMTLLGEPVMVGRTEVGEVFALRNICPHRGMPLHHGCFDGQQIECCYHGWRFNAQGHCTSVPSLLYPQDKYGDKIKVRSYPCQEVQGNIWVFIGNRPVEEVPGVPLMPGFGPEEKPEIHCTLSYPLDADHTAFTLMDPSHVAYVHRSILVKRGAQKLKDKVKHFEPAPFGWRMKRHAAPKENLVYRFVFGPHTTTEISYELPGRRIEHIEGEYGSAVSILLHTPISAQECAVHQSLYWKFTQPRTAFFQLVKPVLRLAIARFLDQDRTYAQLQKVGLSYDPSLMLLGDGDAQAHWFQRLKQTWLQAETDGLPFENPLTAQTLRFRS